MKQYLLVIIAVLAAIILALFTIDTDYSASRYGYGHQGLTGTRLIVSAGAETPVTENVITPIVETNNYSPLREETVPVMAHDGSTSPIGTMCTSSLHYTAMMTLSSSEVPPLDAGMVNVTSNVQLKDGGTDDGVQAGGYRLHLSVTNSEFQITIPYDPELLPQGFTEDDIQTYVYDRQYHRWIAIQRDSINEMEMLVYSRFSRNPLVETLHATSLQTPSMDITEMMQPAGEGGGDSPLDFINAVLKTPEMPETSAYTPTSIKELKAADPLEGLTLMQPPTANNNGTANLSYPIEIPAGRQGMQPNLALSYSSGGGNGWLGVGWDIPIPSITVETRWGVPRYDQSKESEVYVYEGEQLVTKDGNGNFREMPHRTNQWTNSHDLDQDGYEQFFPRKNEAFDSIVRHGSGPSNYWWTVTHKNGVTDYYGKYASDPGVNNNCVLRVDASDQTGAIAHWALAESVDPFGNSVKYYYAVVEDAGVNGSPVMGQQIYLFRIIYTGSQDEPGIYSVWFNRYDNRGDVVISTNRGFKEVTNSVLDNVEVRCNNQTVRTYYFHTTNNRSSNYKTRLEDLVLVFGQCSLPKEELNKGYRTNFSFLETDSVMPCQSVRYSFEYYDYPVTDSLFTDEVLIDCLPNDKIQYNCVKNTFKSTALGATKGKSWSIGSTGAAGLGPDINTTLLTLGGNISYSNSKSEGLLTLVDLDGDGLADKVFKKNGRIYYRKQILLDDKHFTYGDTVEVNGATDFLKESSNTVSIGVQVSAGVSASGNIPLNWTTTTNYFADVNGDGLVDLVTDNGVLFNTCGNGGTPAFAPVNSIATSIPGEAGGEAVYISTQPYESGNCGGIIFDGVVNPEIACTYEYTDILVPVSAMNNYLADSCYVVVGYRTRDSIFEDMNTIQHIDVADSAIVRNICDREEICTPVTVNPDMDAVKVWVAPYSGEIEIFSDIQLVEDNSESRAQSYFVDGVRYSIEHNNRCELSNGVLISSDTKCYGDTIGPANYNSKRGLYVLSVEENDLIFFRLQSQNDRSFDKVKWTQQIKYTAFDSVVYGRDIYMMDNDLYESQNEFVLTGRNDFQAPKFGIVEIQGSVDAENFGDYAEIQIRVDSSVVDSLILDPNMTFQGYPFHAQFFVDSMARVSVKIIRKDENADNPLWANIHFRPVLYYYAKNSPGDAFAIYDTLTCYPQIQMDINHGYESDLRKHYHKLFGELYRGWGQFAYNNHDSLGVRTECIDVSRLQLPKIYTFTSPTQITYEDTAIYHSENLVDTNDIQGSLTVALDSSLYNPMSTTSRWVEMTAYGRDNAYRGTGLNTAVSDSVLDNTPPVVYIPVEDSVSGSVNYTDTTVALEQIQIYDHPVPVNVPGAQVQSIRKRHWTLSGDASFSVDLIFASVGLSGSVGGNFIQSDYMDLNGDGYPDPVATGGVQYTMPWGGIGPLKPLTLFSGDHLSASEISSHGNTFGRCYPTPNRLPGNNSKSSKMTASAGGTSSESHIYSNDYNDFMLTDVNGDGLPDLVDALNYRTVRLNNGYDFFDGELWNIGFIRNGESSTNGSSLGGDIGLPQNSLGSGTNFSLAQVSISGGTGQNQTYNRTTHQLMDINGDGLPDKITLDGNCVLVSYNLGGGRWSPQERIKGIEISKGISYNEDVNIGVTGGFNVCGVLKLNIGFQTSPKNYTFNTDRSQLVDINGDGYPDYVTSDKESRMHVRYNTAGKTNLLKKVVNFMGATIAMDYTLSQPCFEQPHRSWDLASVQTRNNVPYCPVGGNRTRTTFEYGKPHYDRYERIGFGYDTVITIEHNTENNDIAYRKTIVGYNNTNFFKRGRKTTETVLDDQNRPFVETIYDAYLFDLDSVRVSDSTCEIAGIYVGHEAEVTNYYSYENGDANMLTTAVSKVYDSKRNIISYTYEGISNSGFGEWFRAEIEYAHGMPHNMFSQPARIDVYNHGDTLMQRREAVYSDITGKLEQLRVYRSPNDAAVFDFSYDQYGNMDTVLMPLNDSGQRVMMEYQYETYVHTYPSIVRNVSLGYSSSATYDLRLGKPTVTTDINGNEIWYEYDTVGRTVKITAPYEQGNNAPYTIRMAYFPHNFKKVRLLNVIDNPYSYACTYHYDAEHPNDDIRTTLITDGLGRLLQTKKDAELEGHEKSLVTGRVVYDCFGRTLRQYHPFAEDTSLYSTFTLDIDSNSATVTEYDILDRQTRITQPYGYTTTMAYFIGDIGGRKCFVTRTTDAMGKTAMVKSGSLGQQLRQIMPGGVETKFEYDVLGRLTKSIDPDNFATTYEYNMVGQMTRRKHPDAGDDYYVFDPAGNVTCRVNALGDSIKYRYHYSQLTDVEYPRYPANNVHYTYGDSMAGYNGKGRIVMQEDGSGWQTFKYGKLGEVIENIRTFALPFERQTYTFKMQYQYDSYNRIQAMTYPDGEVVSYDYNRGGMLRRMAGNKNGVSSEYIRDIRYNRFELRDSISYGNGTKCSYMYDSLLRLSHLRSYEGHDSLMQDIAYTYDSVGNITAIRNTAAELGNGLGGTYHNTYQYDNLYRLSEAVCKGTIVEMSYYANGRIRRKIVKRPYETLWGGLGQTAYIVTPYEYSYDIIQPNTVRRIFSDNYHGNPDDQVVATEYLFQWDSCGNMVSQKEYFSPFIRTLLWTEENRLQLVSDDSHLSLYLYDAGGERTYKLTGDHHLQNTNGQWLEYYTLTNPTLYASPYLVATQQGYTKHYYAESERIASRIGGGGLSDIGPNVGSLHINHAWDGVLEQVCNGHELLPQPPFNLLAGLYDWQDSVQPEQDIYFYHPDHLGSTSWVTDANGNAVQHLEYLPWGEDLVDQKMSGFDGVRFAFSAKERDSETGLSYFGSRYYSSDLSIWLSVDPMSGKYASLSPYVYCADNPVRLVDPNGMEYGNPIEDALKVISNFEHSTTTSVFRNIPKSKFIEDLTQHINNPASIQQGENGTCGAAVLSKYMAENHPVLYAEAAIALYTTGKFSHNGVSISLPNSAFSGNMTELNELGINSVDAIMQGAFTNSQNVIFNYNPFKDGSGFKSFMYPGYFNYYIGDFIGANYQCVLSPTTEYIKSLDFVNHFVVGVVHSNDYSIEGGFPNHYIQILKSENNKMDYWTWGERVNGSTINNSHRNGFFMIISIGL